MFSISWQGVLMGAGVGVICLLGLGLGLKILLENMPKEGSDEPFPKGKIALAAGLLGGQLLLALGILYFTRNMISSPIGVALGLFFSILLGTFFLKNIRGKKS